MRTLSSITLICALTAASSTLHAQTSPVPNVQETELRACLEAEQEGAKRFTALEQKANELRGSEKVLSDRRAALQAEKTAMDTRKPNADTVTRFNESVKVFNDQTDQLNSDKTRFDKETAEYEQWLNTAMRPACNKVMNRPVTGIVSYYACGLDGQQPLKDSPHCKALPNPVQLKACALKAGSKAKAMETCKGL